MNCQSCQGKKMYVLFLSNTDLLCLFCPTYPTLYYYNEYYVNTFRQTKKMKMTLELNLRLKTLKDFQIGY